MGAARGPRIQIGQARLKLAARPVDDRTDHDAAQIVHHHLALVSSLRDPLGKPPRAALGLGACSEDEGR